MLRKLTAPGEHHADDPEPAVENVLPVLLAEIDVRRGNARGLPFDAHPVPGKEHRPAGLALDRAVDPAIQHGREPVARQPGRIGWPLLREDCQPVLQPLTYVHVSPPGSMVNSNIR